MREVKELLKRSIWATCRHQQSSEKPDVLVYSSRRGGGTWLTELIYATPEFRYILEPFNLWNATRRHRRMLPAPYLNQFVGFDERVPEASVEKFFSDLLSARSRLNETWDFRDPYFKRRTSRTVAKISNAIPLVHWFQETFRVRSVFLYRHPIPTALSCQRNGWGTTTDAYLRCAAFRDRYLDADQIALVEEFSNEQGTLELYVLNWMLENVAMFGSEPIEGVMPVFYEDLVESTEARLRHIFAFCEIEGGMPSEAYVARPSRSRSLSAAESIQRSGSRQTYRAPAWIRRVSSPEIENVQRIFDTFRFKLYRASEEAPQATAETAFGDRQSSAR